MSRGELPGAPRLLLRWYVSASPESSRGRERPRDAWGTSCQLLLLLPSEHARVISAGFGHKLIALR